MMQHIGECNNIQAVVLDRVQLVDFMAVKHKVEIIQIKHVTCHNVREKLFQRGGAASYLKDRECGRIWEILKLIAIKLTIPE